MEAMTQLPLSRVARLKRFFSDRNVLLATIFNIIFIYMWGYLLWGTTEVGSGEWVLEEMGHFLWPSFHTWICILWHKRYHAEEFAYFRWKEEKGIWLWMVLFALAWEFFELWHDKSGWFSTRAQLGDDDTMADLVLSCFVAVPFVIVWHRWKDGVSLFLANKHKKQEMERKRWLVNALLGEIAEESTQNESEGMDVLRTLIWETWEKHHRIRPVVRVLYEIIRGSRQERRRRRASLKKGQS